MLILGIITALLTAVVCFYLLMPVLSGFVSVIFPPVFKREMRTELPDPKDQTDFACIITAYKDTEFAFLLADSLFKQRYENYHIYLVADRCEKADDEPVHDKFTLIYPETPLNSKVASIQTAMDSFIRKHEAVVIFDPDNLAHPLCLQELGRMFAAGFKAVQGWRTAKNLDTTYACLDAAGEAYYHVSQRIIPFRLGSSATIAGSGMAVETDLYRRMLQKGGIEDAKGKVIVAEDKTLQVELIAEGYVIAYAPEALIFDEKVASGDQVQRQRTRWINSWFLYIRHAVNLALRGALKGDSNQLIFGVMISTPPLFLLIIGGVFATLMTALFLTSWWWVPAGSLLAFVLFVLICLAVAKSDRRIWKSLIKAPLFMSRQLLALFRIQESNKSFMETTHHQKMKIDDVIGREEVERLLSKEN